MSVDHWEGRNNIKEFIRKHDDRMHGVVSDFDHMLFRGYLPMLSG